MQIRMSDSVILSQTDGIVQGRGSVIIKKQDNRRRRPRSCRRPNERLQHFIVSMLIHTLPAELR